MVLDFGTNTMTWHFVASKPIAVKMRTIAIATCGLSFVSPPSFMRGHSDSRRGRRPERAREVDSTLSLSVSHTRRSTYA